MANVSLKLRFIAFLCRFLPVQIGAPLAVYHQIRFIWKDANKKFEVFSFMKCCMAVFRHESGNMTSPLYKRSFNLSSMGIANGREQWGRIGETGAEGKPNGYAVYSSYFWATFDYLRWWSVSRGFSTWTEIQAMGIMNTAENAYSFPPTNVVIIMKDYGYFTASEEEYSDGVSTYWQRFSTIDQENVIKWNRIVLIGTISVSLALAFWLATAVNSNEQKKNKWKRLN